MLDIHASLKALWQSHLEEKSAYFFAMVLPAVDQMGVLSNHLLHVCRTFLRRHIRQYLQQHAHLPPKTVVLVALLSPSKQATVRQALEESSSGTAQRLNRAAAAAGNVNCLVV